MIDVETGMGVLDGRDGIAALGQLGDEAGDQRGLA